MIEIIGHRGYAARAPENTLASLDMAIAAGADAVEWDLQFASDGTPVLFHDPNLGRTSNGVGPVRRRTLGQLQALDAGAWFSDDFAGERIPSLAQAMEATKGRIERIYCEVKAYRELEDLDRMVEIVRAANMLAVVHFLSLDFRIVERVAGRDAATRIGYVVEGPERVEEALGRVERNGRGLVDVDGPTLLEHPDLAAMVVRADVPLGAWTVNEVADAERLARLGVRHLTTDEVELLRSWRDGRVGGSSDPTPDEPGPGGR